MSVFENVVIATSPTIIESYYLFITNGSYGNCFIRLDNGIVMAQIPQINTGEWGYLFTNTEIDDRTITPYFGSEASTDFIPPSFFDDMFFITNSLTVQWISSPDNIVLAEKTYIIPVLSLQNEQLNVGIDGDFDVWNGTANGINFVSTCLSEHSLILTPNGEVEIKNLKRSDEIITSDNEILKICRITKQARGKDILVIIKKDTFFDNVPSNDVICNEHHIFWIDGKRLTARCLVKQNKASYFETNDVKALYHLQFERETTYIVSNLICDSVSPYFKDLYLPKHLYFDKTKYNPDIIVEDDIYDTNNNDINSKKYIVPKLTKF